MNRVGKPLGIINRNHSTLLSAYMWSQKLKTIPYRGIRRPVVNFRLLIVGLCARQMLTALRGEPENACRCHSYSDCKIQLPILQLYTHAQFTLAHKKIIYIARSAGIPPVFAVTS